MGPRRRAARAPRAAAPPERELHRLWRERRVAAVTLAEEGATRLRVRFPGWEDGGRGPDFKGAVLETAQGATVRGDVEIHREGRGWSEHGHHRDPAYRAVALHLVWRPGAAATARTVEGRAVPAAVLVASKGRARPADARPCVRRSHPLDPDEAGALLDELGDRRFFERALALDTEAQARGLDRTLYRGLLEALGYSQNAAAFAALAERLPYALLEERAKGAPREGRQALIESLLFGAAGLLPSQRGAAAGEEGWPAEVERRWRALGPATPGRPEERPVSVWQLHRVRPENAPARRIAAAAALAGRFIESGGPFAWARAAFEGPDPLHAALGLRRRLLVRTGGYWAGHWDFARPGGRNPTLLGEGRAGDIVVNVALPFLYGWAARAGDREMASRALAAYRAHPLLSGNRVTREVERMLFPDGARGVVRTARRQQGLIHLYKRRCAGLLCGACAFGRPVG